MSLSKPKVLLVYSGNKGRGFSFPMGLLYVARALIQTGLDVSLLHLGIESINKIRCEDYLFVGISMLTGNMITDGLKIAKRIKEYKKTIPIILGGVHPSLLTEQTLQNKLVDIVVIGEGEETSKELAIALLEKRNLSSVKGIAYKNSEGRVITNPPRQLINIDNIDTDLPYHLFGEYFISKTSTISIHTSRGCPYRCGFCYSVAFHKRKYRQKSAENVVAEIEYYYKKYNILNYDFIYEDEFFIDATRGYEILNIIIKKNLQIRWKAYCRFNTFDMAVKKYGNEFLELLKKSGCICLLFGAESGSQRLLDEIITKDITIDQIFRTIDKMREYKIPHRLNFMNCFPTETEKDIEATSSVIENISKNNPYIAITMSNLAPLPGTSIFNLLVKEYGYIPPSTLDDWGKFNMPIDKKKH
ncbi:MAG: radical SAM protein [Elusimicrobiota bacterium]